MAKADRTATETPAALSVPGLRIETDPTRRVAAGGAFWAGISEVPAAQFDAAQLVELRTHPALTVTDIEVVIEG